MILHDHVVVKCHICQEVTGCLKSEVETKYFVVYRSRAAAYLCRPCAAIVAEKVELDRVTMRCPSCDGLGCDASNFDNFPPVCGTCKGKKRVDRPGAQPRKP